MAQINQKEYLKRYMSADTSDEKKKKIKKKKKRPVAGASVKIIDDDVDISFTVTEEGTISLLDANEDAPQIVGVIDERPLHLRHSDFKTNSWIPVESTTVKIEPEEGQSEKSTSKFTIRNLSKNEDSNVIRDDGSRRKNSDASPPRRKKYDSSPPRRKNVDNDPPRKRNSDNSPPRRKQKTDDSPPRRRNSDNSPPRRNNFDSSPPRRKNRDNSPPRRGESSARSHSKQRKQDSSPPRRRRQSRSPSRRSTSDLSPPRKKATKSLDSSPPRRQSVVGSPDHNKKRKLLPGDSKGRYMIPAKRMTKTLDGKTAAFQNAQDMAKEMETFKQLENDMFDALCKESTVFNKPRERKTGRNADSARKAEERAKREKEEAKYQEIYSRWGHGLKQVQDKEEKLAQDLHEMTKPLARYADDEDLENYLKQQVREGDPMLEFMKKKNPMKPGTVLKQSSTFSYLPNRFGIPPGHQWDGVDRSNGYEIKFIENQNSKLMNLEETFKWSTEDM